MSPSITPNLVASNHPPSQQTTTGRPGDNGQISASALKQIGALEVEKSMRTPVEQKIDSQLLFADKIRRGIPIAEGVPTLRVSLDQDDQNRVLVDIKAEVSAGLLDYIAFLGGKVINDFPQYQAIRANMPLAQIETLAGRGDVSFVKPAVQAMVNSVDSQGDYTHLANTTRANYGVNGAGVKVGVLSDSVDYLTNSQIAGQVTVLTNQDGILQDGITNTGEGTAMLEVVHDLAPGAKLCFATGVASEASFASNISQLASNGCNIIVDDVLFNDESPFQDGIIAQAVNAVTANGVLYFSSASNAGNLDSGTSGTWEGDFTDGGQSPTGPPLNFENGRLNYFSAGTNFVRCLGGSELRADLFWSDPLNASTNDYDLYIIGNSGTNVVASSNNRQNGNPDLPPYESVGSISNGELIVIVKYSGAGRFLHLSTGRGRLNIGTQGSTRGHDCATNAFNVAATDANNSYPSAFVGGSKNPIETFSSDGPRWVFFQADGTPITPGNFSSTGGAVRQKPDITAADGVTNDLPQAQFQTLDPFYGTSCAAPHAAAIAALLMSYNTNLTPSQIRMVLTNATLDIMAPGVDRDSGSGIVMANLALAESPLPNLARFSDNLSNLSPHTGEVVTAAITLTNEPCVPGGSAAGSFHLGFYFSTNASFAGVSPFYEAAINGCPADGIVSLDQAITISAGTVPGLYYLGYKIDDEKEVAECDKGDNGIFYWTVTVLPPPKPNLTRYNDYLNKSTPRPGDTITTALTVTNEPCTGGSANAGSFHIGFYFSSNASFSNSTPFFELPVSGCVANGTVSTNLNILISPTTTAGTYYLGYKINDENEVADCNSGSTGIFYWTLSVQPTNNFQPKFTVIAATGGKIIASLSGLTSGENIVLQASTNLLNWTPIYTNPVNGTSALTTNTINPGVQSQFFRAVIQ